MVKFPLINLAQLQLLKSAINFLKVAELKSLALKLSIPNKGKKGEIIARLLHFIQTGEIINQIPLPNSSKAEFGKIYPLHKETLILKGSYKNDLKTRLFFKQLIGEYFHFTAFGIDYINELWVKGTPPTYGEFAQMWQAEYERRKSSPKLPKEEWAYINFIQTFLKSNPNASHKSITKAWEIERNKQKEIVDNIFKEI